MVVLEKSVAATFGERAKDSLYAVCRVHEGEVRIRIYVCSDSKVIGIDHLLTDDELKELQLTRTSFQWSATEGPGGLRLPTDNSHPRYYTATAAVVAVARLLEMPCAMKKETLVPTFL